MSEPKILRANFPAWTRPWLFGLGVLLVIVTPAVAIVPGPGGVFVFAAGLAMMLKNSTWAKRVYVRFKRRWPKSGDWCDWGLRRSSYKRRRAIAEAAGS
jgi:hypothetical protein